MSGSLSVSLDVTAVPERPAGAGRYVVEVARKLDGHDAIELSVISRRNDRERWTHLTPKSEVHALGPERRPLRLAWEQLVLPQTLRGLGVAVHMGPHYTIPERAQIPKIATIHDMTFYDHPEWHERTKVPVFRRAIKVAVEKASALIAVSHHTANGLRERFGDVNVTPIPLGVDHARFNTAVNDDEALLAEHGVTGDFVVFVGTIEPRKDVPSLLRAFDRIASDHEGLTLVIAGNDGWGVQAFDAALSEMKHGDRVVRPGYLPDTAVPALLRQARAVAYPSLFEGFGLPALEALACGAPLVTTRGSAMEEVVSDAALLIEPGDVDALAGALTTLLQDESEATRMRKRGPEVAGAYTWQATVDAHVDILRRVT